MTRTSTGRPCVSGLSPRCFGKLVTAVRRETAGKVHRGRPWGLSLEDRILLVTAYWRTNLTLRRLAPLFGVSKSAADRGIDHLGPLLALRTRERFHKDTVLIVDGTLVPTRDRTIAEQSKNAIPPHTRSSSTPPHTRCRSSLPTSPRPSMPSRYAANRLKCSPGSSYPIAVEPIPHPLSRATSTPFPTPTKYDGSAATRRLLPSLARSSSTRGNTRTRHSRQQPGTRPTRTLPPHSNPVSASITSTRVHQALKVLAPSGPSVASATSPSTPCGRPTTPPSSQTYEHLPTRTLCSDRRYGTTFRSQ